MDLELADRLENDEEFRKQVAKLATDYVALGQQSLDYYCEEFDAAHDLLMCYAPMTKNDLENLDRGHPKRFVLPMTATQITTMTTFISQMLFGDQQPHKVEGRGPEDETPAAMMNQLLRWNSEQQPTFLLGYLWVQDILLYNRGIRYNCWSPILETRVTDKEVEYTRPDGSVVKLVRPQKTKAVVGSYNRVHLVSPYEFYCDPALPLWRFQEGRFAGHRSICTWQELKRRSLLDPGDPAYVLPAAVEELRDKKKGKNQGYSIAGNSSIPTSGKAGNAVTSRSGFERNRGSAQPMQTADKNDPGMIELHELSIRLVPADNDLYEGDEPVIFQVLVGNKSVVLAINESPNSHDEFPYNVAEGRPNAYYQFSPGWAMMLKPLQDYLDYLKNRRQQSIARTGGNMFIARPDALDLTDFLDPDKDGMIVPVRDVAAGQRLDDIIKQVPVVDMTRDFNKEMQDFLSMSEVVTGVNSALQGQIDDTTTATQFQGTQQMSAGRLASVARVISVQGLVPETRQFVSNFQQFLTDSMSLRFVPTGPDSPTTFDGKRTLTISRDTIQGKFDFIAHDGSLPGTDARKVAAISRLLELLPAAPQYFTPEPGNIDGRGLLLAGAKAAGLQVENFQFKADAPVGPIPAIPFPPEATEGAVGGTSQDGPGRPKLPDMLNIPSAAPVEVRPQNV